MSPSHPGRFAQLRELSGTSFFPIGFLARLPVSMCVIGVLTLSTEVTRSYAVAGLAAGATGAGAALGGPLLGYLADRLRQRWVMFVAALINASVIVIFIALCLGGAEGPHFNSELQPWLVVAAFGIGASSPQVGPLARVRWMALTGRSPGQTKERSLETALSYESTADELTFVLGPALVGILASWVAPWFPLAVATVLTLGFVTSFAFHPTEAVVSNHRSGGTRAPEPRSVAHELSVNSAGATTSRGGLRSQLVFRLGVAVAGMVALGTFFGSAQTSLSAFTGTVAADSGGSSLTGLLYSAQGLSSAIAALSVAFWPSTFAVRWRWLAAGTLLAVSAPALLVPNTLPGMALVLFMTGIPIGPALVSMFSVASSVGPRRWLGTIMTLMSSGLVAGTALGNAIAGPLATAQGYHGAFLTPVCAAIALCCCSIVNVVLARPSRNRVLS